MFDVSFGGEINIDVGETETVYLDPKDRIEAITKNVLLYPVAKCFLDNFPQHYDIIRTYEDAMENIKDIVGKEVTIDEIIKTSVRGMVVKFKLWIDNVRIYSPNSRESRIYADSSPTTPNEALMNRKTYSALIMGDVNYSYMVCNLEMRTAESKGHTIKMSNSWNVKIPIPIGCKYCTLRQYDPLTLTRSGEDMDGVYGYFIIMGFLRYIIPVYTKPYNSPMIQHNEYDEQLSRAEGLFSAGYDYEQSHHIIGSMVRPKPDHQGRGTTAVPIVDYIFSLQMNDKRMNTTGMKMSRKKSLINAVPIKYLFWAFGCANDLEMIKYICPDMNDFGMIHSIRKACLNGKRHIEALHGLVAHTTQRGYLQFQDIFDQSTARYVVGDIILREEFKKHIIENVARGDPTIYRQSIIGAVKDILDTQFMSGVKGSPIDDTPGSRARSEQIRNRAVCYEMGEIIRELYLIGNNISPSMNRISLTNRRIRSGQQIEREFKSFHGVRIRESAITIRSFFASLKEIAPLFEAGGSQALNAQIHEISKRMSSAMTSSLLNSFKGVAKENSKLRTNIITLKNQSFVQLSLRENVISSSLNAESSDVQWPHRVVDMSHLFFVDPAYTPEGGSQVGRYQDPTLYTYTTLTTLKPDILEIIKKSKGYTPITNTLIDVYTIKINGSAVGYIPHHECVETLYEELMMARRTRKIERDATISINHHKGRLDIWTDSGRLVSPFVVVKNCFKFEINFDDPKPQPVTIDEKFQEWLSECAVNVERDGQNLFEIGLDAGYIELIDPLMATQNCMIAPTIREFYIKPWTYSHVALPQHLFGIVSALNPGITLNTGVRASYSTNHTKQAIGNVLNYIPMKYAQDTNVMLAPQIPLVRPCSYDMLHMNDKPFGQNVIIAFLMYSENQSDSFIINRSSVERGLFVIDTYSTVTAECKVQNDVFAIPDDDTTKNGNIDSYRKLGKESSLPKRVGEYFNTDDALISMVTQVDKSRKIDKSVLNARPDAAHPRIANPRPIRSVIRCESFESNTKYKSTIFAQRRVAIAGDKFNSQHAQKGTVGAVFDAADIPSMESGIKPDIIFNPPSVFKRKTYGQIYEAIAGKIASLLGCPIDATPYHSIRSAEDLSEVLKKLGVDEYGYETLYDPDSGLPFENKVFVGVIYMQRQQHLVENKLNIRGGTGSIDPITGLPVKGRKRNGGQSVDRMSNDCINAAGAAHLNKDIHLNQGAKMRIAVCGKCNGIKTYFSNEQKCWFCSNCGRHSDFIIKYVPPATNLISQVLNGLHISLDYRETPTNPIYNEEDLADEIKHVGTGEAAIDVTQVGKQ